MGEVLRESLLLSILCITVETCSEVPEVECVSLWLTGCINEEGSFVLFIIIFYKNLLTVYYWRQKAL